MPAQSNTLVFMVHNEHSNRAEYAPIKHMLWTLKLNLLSIDLRSGGHKWGTKNHTVLHHKDISRPFSIVTEDIKTGLRWAKAYGFQNIFLLGQDTSASLILWLARSEPSLISGILIFSPSEYWIQEPVYHLAGQVRLPLFAASPYAEKLTMNARLNSAVGPHVMKVLNEPGGHGIDLLHQPVVLTKLSAFIKPFIKYVHKQQTPP
jgi:pimeloyl-ACP methyl ester carboxylesterase